MPMRLTSLQPSCSLNGADRGVRTAPPSPQRLSPREVKSGPEYNGRNRYVAVRAEPSLAPSEASATVASEQRAELDDTKQLRLRFGTANLPHPDKSDYGGEDAYFTSPVGGGAFGVADGVGGWQDSGINPAEYSRTFMRLACAYLEGKTIRAVTAPELAAATNGSSRAPTITPTDASLRDEPPADAAGAAEAMARLTPQGALAAAHDGTRLPGSSTACVARLDRATGRLSAANVGDSGFLLVRDGACVFRSPALQHFFDCPLQFAAYPDYTSATDTAEDAGLYELPLTPGDVIVAGTDGLWDNVHQDEILELLPREASQAMEAAKRLVGLASKHANDKKYSSPYSQEAVRQGIDIPWILRLATATFSEGKFKLGHLKNAEIHVQGGKVDDITVVVAFVAEESESGA